MRRSGSGPDQPGGPAPESSAGGDSAPEARYGRILIISDTESISRLLLTVAALDRYEAMVAPNGSAGADAITAWRPAVVLVDMDEPSESKEVRAELRAYRNHAGASVAIIALATGKLLDTQMAELGVTQSLAKPFSIADLLDLLRRYADCA